MLFEKEHIGNPISKQLSQYLRDWTSRNDVAEVATKTGVSLSTIRDVMHRYNRLTDSNAIAIVELMKKAVINCTNKIEYAKKAKKELEEAYEQAG